MYPADLVFCKRGEDAVTKGRSLCCVVIQSPVLRVSWGPGAQGSGREYPHTLLLFYLTCLFAGD